MSDIDQAKLRVWLQSALPGFGKLERTEKLAGGQSNPTYLLTTTNGRSVLRRQPFGDLLPSAHAVDREYRLLSAVHSTVVPVPQPLAMCENPSVIGSMFYIMEFVEGRTFWNGLLPDSLIADRGPIYDAAIDTLAALHTLNHEALGLSGFGASGNYVERQVRRWTRQYRASQTDQIVEVEQLIDWLPQTVPDQTRTAIIHGDYRIDNLIFAQSAPSVAAVLDWELSTIGDPMADFAYFAMHWNLPHDGQAGLAGTRLEAEGIPTLDRIAERYCAATGRSNVPDLNWYFAYNLFRLVGIAQGIKKRVTMGNASSAQAERAIQNIAPLARLAWAEAQKVNGCNGGLA